MRRAPEEKQRDAERTKGRIVQAAIEEFAAKGFAGARVSEIAARAGVNKQLISYYFGGKEGLYTAIAAQWDSAEAAFTNESMSLGEFAAEYVRANHTHRDMGKLLLWRGLDDSVPDAGFTEAARFELERLRARQAAGEFPADIDPAAMFVMLFSIAAASISYPQVVRALYDLDPASAEFAEHYAEQVKRMIDHLRG